MDPNILLNDCRLFNYQSLVYFDCISNWKYPDLQNFISYVSWNESTETNEIIATFMHTKQLKHTPKLFNVFHSPRNLIPLTFYNKLYFLWDFKNSYWIQIDLETNNNNTGHGIPVIEGKYAYSNHNLFHSKYNSSNGVKDMNKMIYRTNCGWIHLSETNEYLGTGHFQYNMYDHLKLDRSDILWGSHYSHFFFTINDKPPFDIRRRSDEFCFISPYNNTKRSCDVIQFIMGMVENTINDTQYIFISYGVNDCISSITALKKQYILNMLKPILLIPQKKINITFVSVVGVEGSGHHLFKSFVKNLAPNTINIKYKNMFTEINKPKSRFYFVESEACKHPSIQQISEIIQFAKDKQIHNPWFAINTVFSYPCSWDGYPNYSKYVEKLKKISKSLFVNIDLKLIVLKREWIETIASSCRRFGHCEDTIKRHYDGALLINKQLNSIASKYWMMVNVDNLLKKPQDYIKSFSIFLNINDYTKVKNSFGLIDSFKVHENSKEKAWKEMEEWCNGKWPETIELRRENNNKPCNLKQDIKMMFYSDKLTDTCWNDQFNIVYVKCFKVGGSTVSGVMRAIGSKLNMSGTRDKAWITQEPGVWSNHNEYKNLEEKISKLQKKTLLITWIREPIERALSAFYHWSVSRQNITPTDDNIIKYLKSKKTHNAQVSYIANPNKNMTIDEIKEMYYFIGTTERFDESMLILSEWLNLELTDILYLKAKDSHHLTKDDHGFTLVPSVSASQQSKTVKEYINNFAKRSNAKDYALWNIVNNALDLAIQNISNFAEKLRLYQTLLKKADKHCYAMQQNLKDCYWNDNGCGITCLNSIKYTTNTNSF
eukprot:240332_1